MAANEVVSVEFPNLRYDITMPFVQGRVQIPGVQIEISHGRGDPNALKTGDFGVRDLNVGDWLTGIEAGWQFIGLPVFSKRKPVYEYIFCRADRGINTPKDLEGKRIGTGHYIVSTTIWVMGLLEHRHGVDRAKLNWVVWRMDELPIHDPNVHLEHTPDPKKTPVQSFLDGDLDALITDISDAKLFQVLETSPLVNRLFPNYEQEDFRLYQETGIYAPAHLLVMSKTLDQQHPDLAGKLFGGLEQAKALAYEDILSDRAGFGVVYHRERLKEEQAKWGDPFKYGITPNKSTIDAFVDYNYEQGMTQSRLSYEQIFAPTTLDT